MTSLRCHRDLSGHVNDVMIDTHQSFTENIHTEQATLSLISTFLTCPAFIPHMQYLLMTYITWMLNLDSEKWKQEHDDILKVVRDVYSDRRELHCEKLIYIFIPDISAYCLGRSHHVEIKVKGRLARYTTSKHSTISKKEPTVKKKDNKRKDFWSFGPT